MKEQTMKEKMLRGSAWMTAGSIISRILGALYRSEERRVGKRV